MMKRRLSRVLTAVLLLLVMCHAAVLTSWAYSFETEEIEISMSQDVSSILSQLGKAENYYEAQSVKHQGKEKVFTYKGFELSTYPSGGVDYVRSIWFLDEETATKEGIHIGSTIQEMKEAYGDDCTEEKGSYIYTSEGTVLTFYTKKDRISGVEYKAAEE